MSAAFISAPQHQALARRSPVVTHRNADGFVVRVPTRYATPAPSRSTYRRRRLVLAAFVLSLVGVVGLAATSGRADHGSTTGSMRTYLVQPGDTLWALADQFHGALSQTAYVDLLVEVNGGATIQTGQQIVLP